MTEKKVTKKSVNSKITKKTGRNLIDEDKAPVNSAKKQFESLKKAAAIPLIVMGIFQLLAIFLVNIWSLVDFVLLLTLGILYLTAYKNWYNYAVIVYAVLYLILIVLPGMFPFVGIALITVSVVSAIRLLILDSKQ